jgi:hypothetical protein
MPREEKLIFIAVYVNSSAELVRQRLKITFILDQGKQLKMF